MGKKYLVFWLALGTMFASCAGGRDELQDQMRLEKVDATLSECKRACIKKHSICLKEKRTQIPQQQKNKVYSKEELKALIAEFYKIAKELERKCKKGLSRCMALCIE